MLEFIRSSTFRRIIAALVAVVVPLLNQKLGMQLDDAQVVAIISAIAVYIAQSGWNAGKQTQADAHVEAANVIAGSSTAAMAAMAAASKVLDPAPTPDLRGRGPFPQP